MTQDYFVLNNMLNIPVDGQIPLHYDKEALEEYLNTEIKEKLMTFNSLEEKLEFLVTHNYIEMQEKRGGEKWFRVFLSILMIPCYLLDEILILHYNFLELEEV